ncbi:MAG TPA: Ig-like domain-containing protein, partial [Dongiaceae bacterium]|nr:Ig-like domain-containing protein [Dongiaceae bacterium]
GAGGLFQSTYQINVGNLADFFLAGAAGPDTTGPRIVSITGDDGSLQLVVSFDEPLSSNTATLIANYTVTPTGGVAIPVTGVVLAPSGRSVTLTLASALSGGTVYVVAVSGVTDVTGNPILPGTSFSFTATLSAPPSARLTVSARTVVRGLSRQGEVATIEAAGPPNSKAVLRVFDLRGRLVKVLFDSRLPANGRRTVTWDTRDESFEFVPAGLYVCHLLTTDPSGHTGETHAPIVVAVRLQ